MKECIICFTPKSGAFIGHVCGNEENSDVNLMCMECVLKMWRQNNLLNHCSVCTRNIMSDDEYKEFLELFEDEIPSKADEYMKEVKDMITLKKHIDQTFYEGLMICFLMCFLILALLFIGYSQALSARTDYYMENDKLYVRFMVSNITNEMISQQGEGVYDTISFLEFSLQLLEDELNDLINAMCDDRMLGPLFSVFFPAHGTKSKE